MKKRILITLTLLSVLIAGCKDATGKKGGAESTTPTEGGSVIVGITQDLDSLDPHVAVAAGTDEVLFNIFEGLVKADENGNVQPAVAEKYVISDDACTYTFTIRDNVKFHNGDVVTTEDVIYSVKRAAGFKDVSDDSVVVESAFSIIEDVYASDDKTVVIKLNKASTELIYYLTTAVIPCDYKEQATHPIGTGPFKFESYSPLESFVIVKNTDYYGESAHLDKVTFKIYANTEAAFLELLGGSVDIMSELTADQANQLTQKYNIETCSYNVIQALFLNNDVKPFDDIRVRKALCMAVNRDDINTYISEGRGTIIGSGMLPGYKTYYDESLASMYPYDTEGAKKLLTEAGYSDGFTFTVKIPSVYASHVATGEVIAEQLKKINVTMKIELIEWSAWLTDVYRNREFEATIIGLDANLAPNDILKRYRTTASNNFINYKNDQYDIAYNLGLNSVDTAVKAENYKLCQKYLAEDAASVYIQDPAQMTAVKKGLSGYTPYPIYVLDMSKIYYTK